ncbi:MAG: hypothetical protein HYY98_14595 [Burkholderiales bacterium]|nr:hypothetical protein [Burkholderiales bacterium]
MLYLVTGANGAGKTLNALKWVRERQIKEGRPVCHNGRFEPVEGGELSAWKKIDIQKWQNEPDGTIFLVDECHNDFPLRAPSAKPPDYVQMLAEHRRRGFDFYLITQHPQNIDAFVRRLIGSPGWHRHLKRPFGGDLVSVQEYPAVNAQCEKQGAGKNGSVTMVPFPRDVFSWYRSASLHTAKKRIPRMMWLLLACVVLVPLLFVVAFKTAGSSGSKAQPSVVVASASESSKAGVSAQHVSVDDYIASRKPRLQDFPHTAPAYDEVTKPVTAPYPAACVMFRGACTCYTQQGTRMPVSGDVCQQIVKVGFFVDWDVSGRKKTDAQDSLGRVDRRDDRLHDDRRHDVQEAVVRVLPMPSFDRNLPGQVTQADIKHLGLTSRNPAMAAVVAGQSGVSENPR